MLNASKENYLLIGFNIYFGLAEGECKHWMTALNHGSSGWYVYDD
jgi:hypothetical protein